MPWIKNWENEDKKEMGKEETKKEKKKRIYLVSRGCKVF
jgi:hypothetical protein